MPDKTRWQTVKARGGQVVAEVGRLLLEGNVRRVVVRQKQRTVAEFPLAVGVVGAVVAPVLAAIGALVALLADCSIEVERAVEAKAKPTAGRKPKVKKAARPRRA